MAILVDLTLTEFLLIATLFVLMDIAGYWTALWTMGSHVLSALPGFLGDIFPGKKFWVFFVLFALILISVGELSIRGYLPF